MDDISVEALRRKASEDDWHSVTDVKKRKQIQDRLAQRARRKRLQRTIKASTKMHEENGTQHVPLDTTNLIPCVEDIFPRALSLPQSSDTCETTQPFNLSYELPYQLTVLTALYINGQILGLSCYTAVQARSCPASADVPLALQPTPTQLLTVHFNGIDRFPFPRMRDNFINMSAVIDEEDLIRDIFTGASFSITPGATSWNPMAWKIDKMFAEKWGFLFC